MESAEHYRQPSAPSAALGCALPGRPRPAALQHECHRGWCSDGPCCGAARVLHGDGFDTSIATEMPVQVTTGMVVLFDLAMVHEAVS